jgi:hypothetical protein
VLERRSAYVHFSGQALKIYQRSNRDGKTILKMELILIELVHDLHQRRRRMKTFLVDILKSLRGGGELTFYSDHLLAVHSCARISGVQCSCD